MVEAVVPGTPQAPTVGSEPLLPAIRTAFRGAIIVNGGYDQAKAEAVVEAGLADAVAFARLYISNPDLVDRFRLDAPLAEADAATTHGGGAKGYIDYPVLQPAAAGE